MTESMQEVMEEIRQLQQKNREDADAALKNATMTHTTTGPQFQMPAGAWPKVGRFALETGGDIAGTVGGGMLGALSPVPGGAVMGAYAGGAIGATAGSLAAETFDPSGKPGTMAGRAAAESVVGGAIGDVAGAALKWMGRAKAMKPGAKEAVEDVTQLAAQRGTKPPKLLPASLTDGRMTDIMENIGGESFLAGAGVKQAKQEMKQAGQDVVDSFARSFRMGNDEPGAVIKAAIEGDRELAEQARKTAWQRLDPMTEDVKVNVRSLKQWAVDFLASEKGRKNRALTSLRKIAQDPRNEMSWQELKNIREQFGALSKPNPQDPYSSLTKGSAEQVYKQISRDLESALSGNREAADLYVVASKMTREIGERSRQALVKSALKQETPEKIYESLILNGRPSTINKTYKFLSPQGRESVQGAFVEDMLKKSVGEDGKVEGKKLSHYLAKLGDEKMAALFPDSGAKGAERFKRVARTLELMEAKPDDSAFGFAARIGQYGSLISIPIRGVTGDAAAVILGPAALAKLVTSDMGYRMLTTGLNIPKDAAIAAPLYSRFITHLTDLGVQFTVAKPNNGQPIDYSKYEL